jgi:hydrogenase small subunit
MALLDRAPSSGASALGAPHGGSLRDETFYDAVARKGIDRRGFLKFCAAVAGMLGLEASGAMKIARALEQKKKIPVVWLEFQDCAGNTESFLRAARPAVDELILDAISLDYHETLMAAAGARAEAMLAKTVKESRGRYIAVVEGSIPMKDGGIYCTIAGRTALEIAREVCGGALMTIAAGTCACYGGLPAAAPNPTGAVSVKEAVPGANVINLSACPFNPANVTATLVHYLTFGRWPALDAVGRPLFAYGTRIHDNCERRAHFDAGRFAEGFGDEGHRHGFCLYKLGCKGPVAFQNCPTIRWNEGMSWPIGAGHPCIACAAPGFWDMSPFYQRLTNVPGLTITDKTADQIGAALVGTAATAMVAHGVAKAVLRNKLKKLEMYPGPGEGSGTGKGKGNGKDEG